MKVVWLSAVLTGRLYPSRDIPGTHSVIGWVDLRVIVRPEGLCQWKIPMTPSRRVKVWNISLPKYAGESGWLIIPPVTPWCKF